MKFIEFEEYNPQKIVNFMLIRVGIGVIIINKDKVLLGKRINSIGHDSWAFTGGHLEYGETPEECAIRETLEETGLEIKNVKKGPWVNNVFLEKSTQYITIFMIAKYQKGIPEIKEPTKCSQWQWFKWEDLPNPLFKPIQTLIESGCTFDQLNNFLV